MATAQKQPLTASQRRNRTGVVLFLVSLVLSFALGYVMAKANAPDFKVVGDCNSGNGIMVGEGSGFTPNGPYYTVIWGTDGKMVAENLKNPGYADSNGHTPGWKYDCSEQDYATGKPPAAGTRHVRITDLTTGKSTKKVSFTVGKG